MNYVVVGEVYFSDFLIEGGQKYYYIGYLMVLFQVRGHCVILLAQTSTLMVLKLVLGQDFKKETCIRMSTNNVIVLCL